MDNPPRDKASLIAMRFIDLFNQSLEREGIHTHIAFEQEMDLRYDRAKVAEAIHTVTGQRNLPQDIVDACVEDMVGRHFKESPAAVAARLKFEGEKRSRLRKGPVERFYKEAQSGMFEVTTTPSPPLRAGHRVAGMRRFLKSHEDAPESSEKSGFGISALAFDPFKHNGPGDTSIYGLHGNISFTTTSPEPDGKTVHLMYERKEKPFGEASIPTHMRTSLGVLAETDLALLADDRSSYHRLSSVFPNHAARHFPDDASMSENIFSKKKKDRYQDIPEKHRVEFTLPDARSNPYFTTLFMMAAAYHALHEAPQEDWRGEGWTAKKPERFNKGALLPGKTSFLSVPQDFDEAEERFHSDSRVVELMRMVAREVGTKQDLEAVDEFKSRIEAHLQQKSAPQEAVVQGR